MSAQRIPDRLAAKRRRTGQACVGKLEAAATALRAYLQACNDCGDESASLRVQGKGVDSREALIADLAEYARFLDDRYGSGKA